MTTLSRADSPAKSSRKASRSKPFSCSFVSITIEISDTRYSVDEIPCGEFGSKAFRLSKHSGDHAVYDVVHNAYGCVACDCPDYIARHDGTSSLCKHGKALVTLGLMPMPVVPVTAASTAPCCDSAEPEPCKGCVEALDPRAAAEQDDAGDASTWPAWTDADTWSIGPDDDDLDADDADRLTLAELVDRQCDRFESWRNDAGRMLAEAMRELAYKIRLVDAQTPADYDARVEVLEAEAREAWEAIGFENGRAAIACEPAGSAFGHMA